MTYFLGADEAGYGPNLGPLVVGCSVWDAPDAHQADDLDARLAACVRRAPKPVDARVCLADSKALYTSGGGWRGLEHGLFAALDQLAAFAAPCADEPALWDRLASGSSRELLDQPVHDHPEHVAGYRPAPPCAISPAERQAGRAALRVGLAAANVQLASIAARAVFPREFNRRLSVVGLKSTVLTETTLGLMRAGLDALPDDGRPAVVTCDKHGGRDDYAPSLGAEFSGIVTELTRSRSLSRYQLTYGRRKVLFVFRPKGESHVPCALASMLAKYLRELAMARFNAAWSVVIPGLVHTAGYPQDAKRFMLDSAAARAELAVDEDALWRRK